MSDDYTAEIELKPTQAQRLKDRVAIVTGSGRGIGQGIAKLFASHGAKVLVATRTGSVGQATVDGIRSSGGTAECLEVTFGTPWAASAAVARAGELWGRLDVIIHNASSTHSGLLTELPDSALQDIFDSSVNTAFWLIKQGFPLLKASPAGRFIVTSSTASKRAQPGYAAYGAMKGSLDSLIRGAAIELGPHGITVNAVAPGGTRSASFDANIDEEGRSAWERMIPMRRVGLPADIANAMLYLASAEAGYVTGQVIRVDGGQTLGQRDPW